MQAYTCRWWSSIYRCTHSGCHTRGICICGYMPFQGCAGYVAVSHEPELLVGVPPPAGRFDPRSQGQIGGGDPDRELVFQDEPRRRRFQSVFSTISSIVFSRWPDSASYRYRTQTRAAPYFFTSLLVPRCPGLRTRRVFMPFSGKGRGALMIGSEAYHARLTVNSQMPGHRLPEPNAKKCQDIGYPDT